MKMKHHLLLALPPPMQFYCLAAVLLTVVATSTPLRYVQGADEAEHEKDNDRRRELQVLQHLMQAGYTYYTRPLTENNETLEVRVRVSIIKIQNLWERTDVKTEALETTMRIQLNWCDDLLSWEPDHFGGVDSVIIPGDRLWIPDIQVINALDDVYTLTRDRRFDFKLHSDGCVWWYPTGTILTRCQLDLSYFPFDIQTCPIIFESAMYPKEYLNLTMRYDKRAISLKTFTENGQWDLLRADAFATLNYVTESTAFARVEIRLMLGRKTLYYQMNVLCPCGMLSALQILTFLLPIGSEDRISQSTTVLLSFVVFQSVAVAELPRTSTSVPLLCLYIDFLTGVSVLTVTNAIISVYILKTTQQTKMIKQQSVFLMLKGFLFDRVRDNFSAAGQRRHHQTTERPQTLSLRRNRDVGISVNEGDIFDTDSLDGDAEQRRTSSKTSNGRLPSNGTLFSTHNSVPNFHHYQQQQRTPLREMSSTSFRSTDPLVMYPVTRSNFPPRLPSANTENTIARFRVVDKRLQTAIALMDNIVFVVVMTSTVFVPLYMFSIYPPDRESYKQEHGNML